MTDLATLRETLPREIAEEIMSVDLAKNCPLRSALMEQSVCRFSLGGTCILGLRCKCHPKVVNGLTRVLRLGAVYGRPTRRIEE